LVTHQLQYLPDADKIYVLDEGKISQQGTYNQISSSSDILVRLSESSELLTSGGPSGPSSLNVSLEVPNPERTLDSSLITRTRDLLRDSSDDLEFVDDLRKSSEIFNSSSLLRAHHDATTTIPDAARLIEDEDQNHGTVGWNIYSAYLLLGTGSFFKFLVLCSLIILAVVFEYAQTIWLVWWSEGKFEPPVVVANMTSQPQPPLPGHPVPLPSSPSPLLPAPAPAHGLGFYLGIYTGIVGFDALCHVVFACYWFYGCLVAAKHLHDNLLNHVIRAPLSFFHTNPTGRIVNRLTCDLDAADLEIPENFYDLIQSFTHVGLVAVLIVVSCPWLVIPIIPFVVVCFYLGKTLMPSSRELTRLQAVLVAPVFSNYTELLNGLTIIRAFKKQKELSSKMCEYISNSTLAEYYKLATQSHILLLLDITNAIFMFLCSVVLVLNRDILSPGMIGLILSLLAASSEGLSMGMKVCVEVEGKMAHVERIMDMDKTEPEADWIKPSHRPPASWPSQGKIEFSNLSMAYSGNKLVLKNISFTINAQQKVGVVGRTGAGKSSLIMALFRLVEPSSGLILIDDYDISKIGLHDLRKKLSIIPQDPVLFVGTIRSNLDPFENATDDRLWDVLERIHLKNFVESQTLKLDHKITANGANLSVGQRQLICIGRALLNDSQILVMDEATASVDNATDGLIQDTIRSEFKHKTVITIAHRLNTIMDSDIIMVLDEGNLKEFDTPRNLLSIPGGLFDSLVEDTGPENARILRSMIQKEN